MVVEASLGSGTQSFHALQPERCRRDCGKYCVACTCRSALHRLFHSTGRPGVHCALRSQGITRPLERQQKPQTIEQLNDDIQTHSLKWRSLTCREKEREACHSEVSQTDLRPVSSNTHPSSTDKTQTPQRD